MYTVPNHEVLVAQSATGDWVDLYLPENVRSYARLARVEKPIGSWLLAWPFAWSLALAADQGSFPDMKMLSIFSLWAFAIRGAACTINDYFDRDIDSKVERTKNRPMACGDVTPNEGFGILGLLHVPSVVAYPLMKRLTNWWGYCDWSVVKGSLDPAVLIPLYVGCFFWTLIYDTIYAHQDKKDDVKIGVKSTAVLLGESTKPWLTVFGITCITCFAISGFNADIGYSFYPLLGIAACHLAWQIWTTDLSSPTDCNNKFVSNIWFGAIIFSAIMIGRLLP
ncbi:hypothetical protein Leryth_006101 [Lithospermum erythrorhizon]|nr:hypothetical protein Leryth_006101 [Lithospermum erythrorhizon]